MKIKTTDVQNNYYLLRKLADALQKRLSGTQILACFSQSKNELVIGFAGPEHQMYIRASLAPDFSCLSFPADFARAKKNSADLFPGLLGREVSEVRVTENDRSFSIFLSGNSRLFFKMHGNRANIIFIENEQVKDIFRKKLTDDSDDSVWKTERKISQDFEFFKENGLQKTFPTFGKEMKKAVDTSLPPAEQWAQIQDILARAEEGKYYLFLENDQPKISLLEPENPEKVFDDPVEALNEFYFFYVRKTVFDRTQNDLLRKLRSELKKTENYLLKTQESLEAIRTEKGYDRLGDILMANLHAVPKAAESVELFDFYENEMIVIKLKKTLSPQHNAEQFYRKNKNRKIEIAKLEENAAKKREIAEKLREQISLIEGSENLKSLRKTADDEGLDTAKNPKEKAFPFKKFVHENYEIWVGKNAANNDLLTQKYAYKEDLWLHARDVTGSHVIIKHQAGKVFPQSVIERAAGLAAYYSKRKSDTLCPVIVTPKKYVRKPKGSVPGSVVVDKEDVILVEPAL